MSTIPLTTTATVSSVKDITKLERVGAHSHIKGLGLNELLEVQQPTTIDSIPRCGLVGQESARRAVGIVYKLIKEGKIGGRAILLAGPPGTGKVS
jgi:RuvB-like protein 2